MDEIRDTELGEKLQILAEPDHGPDYWDQVRLQVAEAAAERQPRAGLGRRLRAAFGTPRLRLAVAAAALAAVAAVAVLFGLPRAPGPETVSAAEVLKRSLSACSSGRTWQADVVTKATDWNRSGFGYHYDVRRYRLVRSAGGSYRLTLTGQTQTGAADAGPRLRVKDELAYDASTGVLRHLRPGRELVVMKDYPLGPPDRWASPLTGVDFGAALRAMMAAGAFKLEGTVLDGRPAWTVVTSKGAGVTSPAGSAQGIDWPVYKVTVDKQTWLPVRFQQVEAGILTAELRVRNARVNGPLPKQVFTLRPLKGLTTRRVDSGFRRVTLDDERAFAAVTPLVPGCVPKGYDLAYVAVAPRAQTANHLFRAVHVFALQYTHGFDALTVSTRTVEDANFSGEDDPVDSYDSMWSDLVRTETRITSGAFAGTRAWIVVATTSSTPHLWAVKDGVLLTIAGGATAEELLAVANSLQVYPG
ncbi:MAG: hypothetical protein NTX16_13470, partial [Actinobacteria bacterium]|nr:hypothetical protein [Actinomycetota bacterium]